MAGKATIIGIVSWGKSGCPVGRPAVYTNVAKFSNWIEEIISDTNITTSTTKNWLLIWVADPNGDYDGQNAYQILINDLE